MDDSNGNTGEGRLLSKNKILAKGHSIRDGKEEELDYVLMKQNTDLQFVKSKNKAKELT